MQLVEEFLFQLRFPSLKVAHLHLHDLAPRIAKARVSTSCTAAHAGSEHPALGQRRPLAQARQHRIRRESFFTARDDHIVRPVLDERYAPHGLTQRPQKFIRERPDAEVPHIQQHRPVRELFAHVRFIAGEVGVQPVKINIISVRGKRQYHRLAAQRGQQNPAPADNARGGFHCVPAAAVKLPIILHEALRRLGKERVV